MRMKYNEFINEIKFINRRINLIVTISIDNTNNMSYEIELEWEDIKNQIKVLESEVNNNRLDLINEELRNNGCERVLEVEREFIEYFNTSINSNSHINNASVSNSHINNSYMSRKKENKTL